MAIAYVCNALSFIFIESTLASHIRKVYLYGSAARGELTEKSDIDVFIDCSAQHEKIIEQGAKAAITRFYQSLDFKKWPHLQGTYPITVCAGELNQWELKNVVETEGILVYSNTPFSGTGKRHSLFMFTLPKNKKKYLSVTRRLFGRKEKGYKDAGILGIAQGKKIGATVILAPSEGASMLCTFFNNEKIDYSFKECIMVEA